MQVRKGAEDGKVETEPREAGVLPESAPATSVVEQGWRAPKAAELVTPGLSAAVLLGAFLLVLFATESGRRPGTGQIGRQEDLYAIYVRGMLVGWTSASKPRTQWSARGAVELVSSATNIRLPSRAGQPRTYEIDTAYAAGTTNPIYVRGVIRDGGAQFWECALTKEGIEWREMDDTWQAKRQRLFKPETRFPFILQRYSVDSWEQLLRRAQFTEEGVAPLEVELFDVETLLPKRLICSQIETTWLKGRKGLYWLVQFGPDVHAYVSAITKRIDCLELPNESTVINREGASLFEQLPKEATRY